MTNTRKLRTLRKRSWLPLNFNLLKKTKLTGSLPGTTA